MRAAALDLASAAEAGEVSSGHEALADHAAEINRRYCGWKLGIATLAHLQLSYAGIRFTPRELRQIVEMAIDTLGGKPI